MKCETCENEAGDSRFCKDCWTLDRTQYILMNEQRKITREKNRKSLTNILKRNKMEDRAEFINEGTVLMDGKYYYYVQKKKARVKGQNKYYQMRGFQHFVDTFLKGTNK